jgi:hypothetical protein
MSSPEKEEGVASPSKGGREGGRGEEYRGRAVESDGARLVTGTLSLL